MINKKHQLNPIEDYFRHAMTRNVATKHNYTNNSVKKKTGKHLIGSFVNYSRAIHTSDPKVSSHYFSVLSTNRLTAVCTTLYMDALHPYP
jgi:hypothetical protein